MAKRVRVVLIDKVIGPLEVVVDEVKYGGCCLELLKKDFKKNSFITSLYPFSIIEEVTITEQD